MFYLFELGVLAQNLAVVFWREKGGYFCPHNMDDFSRGHDVAKTCQLRQAYLALAVARARR